MDFQELLLKIAKIFERLKIIYCITGGYAVSVWGRPRATFDLDVIVKLSIEKLSAFSKALKSLSVAGYLDEDTAKSAIENQNEFNFIHPESGLKIDFWVIKNDSVGMAELKRRQPRKIGKQTVYFISPEDLILSKLLWHKESESTRHLEDIESVIAVSRKILDFKYLKSQAEKRGFSETLNKIIKNSKF